MPAARTRHLAAACYDGTAGGGVRAGAGRGLKVMPFRMHALPAQPLKPDGGTIWHDQDMAKSLATANTNRFIDLIQLGLQEELSEP